MGLLKDQGTMQAVDLNKLVEPYFGTGLYLAVTKDNTAVVATGKTIQDAVDQAADHGWPRRTDHYASTHSQRNGK